MDYSPPGSYPWNFSGKNTGVGCHFLLQGIFPTQKSNSHVLHLLQVIYHSYHLGSPWGFMEENKEPSLYELVL